VVRAPHPLAPQNIRGDARTHHSSVKKEASARPFSPVECSRFLWSRRRKFWLWPSPTAWAGYFVLVRATEFRKSKTGKPRRGEV